MQFGGECEGINTPFTEELPELQVNSQYYLFLQSTNGGESDFYISGAGQGWFILDSEKSYESEEELKRMGKAVFEERNIRRGMHAWNPYMSIQVAEGSASDLNIGLAHNTTSVSTMYPSHNSQPGYPQYPDILALSEIYS